MKLLNAFLVCLASLSVGRAGCFYYEMGPITSTHSGVQVSVLAVGSNGSCICKGTPAPSIKISGSVHQSTLEKYSFSVSGNITASPVEFGLESGCETETTVGSSGTAEMTINTWCTAHNVDAAKDYTLTRIIHYRTCNGTIEYLGTASLSTVTSYYPRCPGNPDAPQPTPCDSVGHPCD